jgi:Tat protein translocase TatC
VKARAAGEMPFLDHLEELRVRILRSLLAVVACFALGLWLTDRLRLLDILKQPIAPYLPEGKLVVLSPTEPLMITLKLGFIVGLVLASPVLLWQLWAFLSPALYEREKKTIVPALFAGLVLFLAGGVLSFEFIVPQALRVLMSFQRGSFATMITFDAYFSFVMQLVLALGLSCELPLLMIILAALGLIGPPLLSRIRPYAVVGSFVAGAILSPGTDVISMFMLTIPLLLLFELGVAGVWLVERRRLKAGAAGTVAVLLLCLVPPAQAQQPVLPRPGQPVPPGQRAPADTGRAAGARRLDSAVARRLNLPSAPRLQFLPADSIITQLMELKGYDVTRYRADTAKVHAVEKTVDLNGGAMTERSGSVLEATSIRYQEGACGLDAKGEPHLFQEGQVLIGNEAHFDTCKDRGVVREAFTNLTQAGGNWFIRGHLAIDSNRTRLYGGAAELTSCDLPIPHYHFAAREMKWVSRTVLVARPAVLYIRDVPVAWIPFLFQDAKADRHSGILVPQFGFNDIVRPQRNYNRQITNIGYYWAPNDYFDAQLQLDWYSNRYLRYGISTQYRIRDRFMTGGLQYVVTTQPQGGAAKSVSFQHQQNFNVSTSINANISYSTNPNIVLRNSLSAVTSTQQITSQARFTKRYRWGNLDIGGNRFENITDKSGTMLVPSLTLSPKELDVASWLTWSPNLSFTNQIGFNTPLAPLLAPGAGGGVDTTSQLGKTRTSTLQLQTPLRFGSFTWSNSIQVVDGDSTGRYQTTFRTPNLDTPEPDDSITVTQYRKGGFSTTVDWNTSIGLPILFRGSWKLTPSVGIANTGPGPFAVRNAFTAGRFLQQGKRLLFSAGLSPTFFGFFGGIGPIARFRHSVSPSISYSYSPAATVPEEYARAIAGPGRPPVLRSPPSQTISLTLSQNLEAKLKPPSGDTAAANQRKLRILSINTSSISYDFEQAKLPGRTGWTTSQLNNTVASDLLPGFNLSVGHDLWDGPVGYRSAKFSPFLTSVSSTFSISSNTLRSFASLFGLAKRPAPGAARGGPPPPLGFGGVPLPGASRGNLLTPNQQIARAGRPFSMNVSTTISRTRPTVTAAGDSIKGTSRSNVGINASFSPTSFWGVTWSTQYNATKGTFESQQISLARDLHEWRATFNFSREPGGNFTFYFAVFLSDFPDLNYKYNQSTIRP